LFKTALLETTKALYHASTIHVPPLRADSERQKWNTMP
jgi:hypothetical protein